MNSQLCFMSLIHLEGPLYSGTEAYGVERVRECSLQTSLCEQVGQTTRIHLVQFRQKNIYVSKGFGFWRLLFQMVAV